MAMGDVVRAFDVATWMLPPSVRRLVAQFLVRPRYEGAAAGGFHTVLLRSDGEAVAFLLAPLFEILHEAAHRILHCDDLRRRTEDVARVDDVPVECPEYTEWR